jgi:hypothetical protein
MIVMAGLVPATHTHRSGGVKRCGYASSFSDTSAFMDGRDKPGHDDQN